MLASKKPTIAATATKIAVHAACFEMAFKLMEIPSIPDPAKQYIFASVANTDRHIFKGSQCTLDFPS
jgi:hypothetical protein